MRSRNWTRGVMVLSVLALCQNHALANFKVGRVGTGNTGAIRVVPVIKTTLSPLLSGGSLVSSLAPTVLETGVPVVDKMTHSAALSLNQLPPSLPISVVPLDQDAVPVSAEEERPGAFGALKQTAASLENGLKDAGRSDDNAYGSAARSWDGSGNRSATQESGPRLQRADVPEGFLAPKVLDAFFRDNVAAKREEAAASLKSLRSQLEAQGKTIPKGIIPLGDRSKTAMDAFDNAKDVQDFFRKRGENVLVLSGHGGPGPGGMGTFVSPAEDGTPVFFYANTPWGALELKDVLMRAGYDLEGYDSIVFATCHGGCASEFAKLSKVRVIGTNPEGMLHYASGLVRHPESGYTFGMFPDPADEAATKVYPPGR